MMFILRSRLNFIGNVFQMFYNTVDTMVVGRFVGAGALAAVGGSGVSYNVMLTLINGFTSGAAVVIAQAFGGGDSFSQKGWTVMAIIYAIVIAATTLIGFFFTNERVTMANREMETKKETEDNRKLEQERIGLLQSIKGLLHNKYWVIFVISMIMVSLNGTFGSTAMYYAQYILGDEMLFTSLNNIKVIVALGGTALGFMGMVKFKKRDLVVTAMGILTIGLLLPLLGVENRMIVYIGAGIAGIGTGLAGCVLPGMLMDTLTYGQWRFGFDMMGIGAAGFSFSQKVSGSLGSLLLGWVMTLTNFVEKAPVQSTTALSGITAMYTWIPAILMGIALISMLKYDLDDHYDKIVDDLKEGKTAKEGEK